MEHVSGVGTRDITEPNASDFPNQQTPIVPYALVKDSNYFMIHLYVTELQDQVTEHRHQKLGMKGLNI